jgi:hypothetical protein
MPIYDTSLFLKNTITAGEPEKGTRRWPCVVHPSEIEIFVAEMEHIATDARVKKCDRYLAFVIGMMQHIGNLNPKC